MGCCGSDDLPKKGSVPSKKGEGVDDDGYEEEEGAEFLSGIYTRAGPKAQDTLRKFEEFDDKGNWAGDGSPETRDEQEIGNDHYHG